MIKSANDKTDCILTYGEILNLHLNQEFYTNIELQENIENTKKKQDIIFEKATDAVFPLQTRKIIADYLISNGVDNPKVLMMTRIYPNTKPTHTLVFNITPDAFQDENAYLKIMQAIKWFLPKHYAFIGIDESNVSIEFESL